MASSLLCQILYVEEEEEYLVANRCHVRRKVGLGNDSVNKKTGRSGHVRTIYNWMKDLQYRLIRRITFGTTGR